MYCNHIWGNTYKTNLSKLQALQNKAVRIVTGSSRRSNIENMYRCNGIMNLDFINTYLVGKSMYKVYHKGVLTIFYDFFQVQLPFTWSLHKDSQSFACAIC